ncbi:MAG: hypothetical protein CVU90_13960 [Firmicutes bacterium HGW-Firmicutes-15]|nr:MAG: hypothetical protein CVU90_13960 [Firmicutes bacterium HGW-Firmicutes-15]
MNDDGIEEKITSELAELKLRVVNLEAKNQELQKEVTNFRGVEQALKESETHLRLITNSIPDSIIIIDNDGIIQHCSKSILGYEPASVIKSSIFDYIHPDDLEKIKDNFHKTIDMHLSEKVEYRCITIDGYYMWAETIGSVILDEKDQPSGVVFYIRDVSERKQIEGALRLSEEKFSKAFHCNPDPITITTWGKGRYIEINNAWIEATGYKRSEAIEHTDIELGFWVALEDRDIMSRQIHEQGSIRNFETMFRMKSGEIRIYLISAEIIDVDNNKPHLLCVHTDITDQLIMEERLRKSEAELRSLIENANGIIYSVSSERKFNFVSPGWTELLGHDLADVRNHPIESFIHPDDIYLCRNYMDKVIATGKHHKGVEYRVKHKNGKWRWHTSSGMPVKDESGINLYYVGMAIDITERKQAEKALQESEQRFREMLENIKLAAVMLDKKGRLTFCNEYFLQLLGRERKEAIGQDWAENCLPPDVRERDMRILNRSLEKKAAPSYGESEIQTKTGERRIIMWSNIFLNSAGNAVIASIGEDVTERRTVEKRNQELILELESTNRELKGFTSIISHELNSSLRGITALADWLYSDYYDSIDEQGREHLTLLQRRTIRMHNFLNGLLRYLRISQRREEKTKININTVLTEVIEMLVLPDNISIVIDNEMPLLVLENMHIQLVFENLISNSIRYMDKNKGQIKISCQQQGEYWKFSIQDNGPGIDAKYFERIFRIFQTLKPRDEYESTGIGLSIVKKIVELYGGKVWVESKIGVGSTFHFTLPDQNSIKKIKMQTN